MSASAPRASASAAALEGVLARRPDRTRAKVYLPLPDDRTPVPPRGSGRTVTQNVDRQTLADLFRRKTSLLIDRIVAGAPKALLQRALAEPTDLDMVATGMEAVLAPATPLMPEERARVAARAAARTRGIQYMTALLERAGGAYSAQELADVLAKDGGRATIAAGRKSGLYFGLPTADGAFAYPKLQVTRDGAVLPGLRTFLRSFTLPDPWMQLVVLLEASPALGGRSPLDALRAGDVDAASVVARAYGSHGA